MIRMSSLPLSQFCGASAALSAQHGAGRAAAVSTAFHARCAGSLDAPKLLALLTDEEREELEGWHVPPDVVLEGIVLRYADAEKELELALNRFGQPCEPQDAITVGHLDFAWVHRFEGHPDPGQTHARYAYVADIKRSRFTSTDGPESLQLHAYGWAFAKQNECEAYCTGIWVATDGEWQWSSEMVVFGTERANLIWERLRHAAENNTGEYATGPHCNNCYARLHCQEFLVPAAALVRAGLPTQDEIVLLEPAAAGALLQKVDAASAMLEALKKTMKAAVTSGKMSVTNGNGKKWVPVMHKGKESLDKDRVRELIGEEEFAGCMRRGASYPQMTWVNNK